MIASVRGVVQDIETGNLVIEIGGVGVRVAVPESILDETVAIGVELQLGLQIANNYICLICCLVLQELDQNWQWPLFRVCQ